MTDATVDVWVRESTAGERSGGHSAARSLDGLDPHERARWARLADPTRRHGIPACSTPRPSGDRAARRPTTGVAALRPHVPRLRSAARRPTPARRPRAAPVAESHPLGRRARTQPVRTRRRRRRPRRRRAVRRLRRRGTPSWRTRRRHKDIRRTSTTWVRKEAALKALGVGLRIDPTTFVTPASGVPAASSRACRRSRSSTSTCRGRMPPPSLSRHPRERCGSGATETVRPAGRTGAGEWPRATVRAGHVRVPRRRRPVPDPGRDLPHERLDVLDELVGGHRPVPVGRDPVAQEVEEGDVTELQPQGVQGQGAALVDAVVEHEVGPGVGEHDVLRADGRAGTSGSRR